jgi:general L-amino acid transport system permease protein
MAAQVYVRTESSPALPPPARERGIAGWIMEHLFSSPLNVVLTLLSLLLLVWIVPPLLNFLIFDATWVGEDRAACIATPDRPRVGACWAFVSERINFFIYGFYPIEDRWRVDIFFALLAFGVAWMAWLDAPRRDLGAIYFFVIMPVVSCFLLVGLPAAGLEYVSTAQWGGVLVTIVVAAVGIVFSLPIGIVLALGRRSEMPVVRLFSVIFIEFVRGVPLITVLFMASVMLPLFVPDAWSPCSRRPTWPRWCARACRPSPRASTRPPWRSAWATGRPCG